MFSNKIIAVILLVFFFAAISVYIYLKNYYVPGTIIFLRNEGVYLYRNFASPIEVIKPNRVSSAKLSPDGNKIFYSYYSKSLDKPYDVGRSKIYFVKSRREISISSLGDISWTKVSWTKDSNKLLLDNYSEEIIIFDINTNTSFKRNKDDPIIAEQRYIPSKSKNWDRNEVYEIMNRAAFSPDGTKVLLDKESELQNGYNWWQRNIYLMDLNTGKERLLIKNGGSPSWSR